MSKRNSLYYWSNSLLSIFVWIVFFVSPASSQFVSGLNKDSLRQVVFSSPNDSSKVLLLITLGQQYESNLPDSAIYYYQKAKTLSSQINYPTGIIKYINNYTAILNVRGRFEESLKLHQYALDICKKYDLKELEVKTLANIGVVYQYKQDYDAALHHYLKNLPILEEYSNPQILASIYGNICGIYLDLGQYAKANVYADKELKMAYQTKDMQTIGSSYINKANTLKGIGQMQTAIRYLEKSYVLGQKIDDINIMETALINMGDLQNKSHIPSKALVSFRRALPLTESLEDIYGKSLALNGIAYAYFLQKKYPEADQEANTALLYAQQHDQKETQKKILMLLSDIKIATGDIAGSENMRSLHDSINTAMANADLLKDISVMESKYEVEKKQSQILRQNLLLENKNRQASTQRMFLWIAIAGILLLGFVLFWSIRSYRQRQLLNQKEMEALKIEQENEKLKAKLEGQGLERRRISQEMHDDISAGLTSVLFLSRTIQGQESISFKLSNLSQELVQRMNEIIWTMNDEQDNLENLLVYIRKQMAEMLENANLDFQFYLPENTPSITLSQEYRRNIYLICKEAVHNIIKHADAKMATIRIATNQSLEITITDNGKGFNNNNIFGNGLNNMQRRIAQLNGNMTMQSIGNGTELKVTAPLIL